MSFNDNVKKLNRQTENIYTAGRAAGGFVSISKAAKFLSVSPDTLRNWETQNKLVPQRTSGGARRYDWIQLKEYKKFLNPVPQTPTGQLSVSKTAKELQVSPDTIRNWDKRGIIKATRTEGGSRRFSRTEIKRLQEELNITVDQNLSYTNQPDYLSKNPNIDLPGDRPVLNSGLLIHPSFIGPEENNEKSIPQTGARKQMNLLVKTFSFAALGILFLLIGTAILKTSLINKENQKISAILKSLPFASLVFPSPSVIPAKAGIQANSDWIPDQVRDDKLANVAPSLRRSLAGEVLAESTPSSSFLQINLDTEINGDASISGTLTAPNILYSLTPGTDISITGDPQRPTISSTLTIDDATTSVKGIASFSNSFFTLTSGAVSLKEGGITTTEIKNGTIANGDLASSSITISPGSGMSGGGAVSLGGSVTLTSVLGSTVSLTSEVEGVLPIANGGSNKALTLAAGGVLWTDFDSFEVTAAGTSGQVLTSGGTGTPTWTTVAGLGVSWSSITDPSANLSLSHSTYTTTFNWATGTGSNNLFNLTSDASANGTGALLNIQTGTSSTLSPLRVRAGSTESLFVDSGGNVGIGTTTGIGGKLIIPSGNVGLGVTSPSVILDVGGSTYDRARIQTTRYSTDVGTSFIWLRKARGTEASPLAISSGDPMGTVGFIGYNASDFQDSAYISAVAEGAPGATYIPTYLYFSTASSLAAPTEKMRIASDGNVGIGDTSPDARLEIGDNTDSLRISSVGDITFVDADGVASITGPAGGAFSVVAGAARALTLTGNLGSTWSTSNGVLTVSGDDGLTLTSVSTAGIVLNTVDAIANAFDLQQGSDNYINVNTSDGTENISFGNAVTNPSFSFLGTGAATIAGSGEGTASLTQTLGDHVITDGDLTISGGEISATTDDTTTTGFAFVANTINSGNGLTLSGTGMTTGEILDLTGTWAPTDGSTNEAIDINITHTPTGSLDTFESINLTTTDGTSLANNLYNFKSTLTLTGDAAKTAYGIYSTISTTSTSTTADTLYASYFTTSATGALSAGTRNNYGVYSTPASTANSDAGTLNLYGGYFAPSSTLSSVNTGSAVANNVYGAYITNTATVDNDCTSNCAINSYSLYIADGTSSTNGTSTKYGIYVAAQTAADSNFGAYIGSNVGIGADTTPDALLEILGTAPASVSTTPGTTADTALIVTGAAGGATTHATGTGGTGSLLNLTSGAGGAASGATSIVGGTGGVITVTAGDGGAVSTGTTRQGGTGGSISITAGAGGSGNSGATSVGGNISIIAGGNAGITGNSNGGSIYIAGGVLSNAGANGNVLLAIDSSGTARGNVGIATTAPQTQLSIDQTDADTTQLTLGVQGSWTVGVHSEIAWSTSAVAGGEVAAIRVEPTGTSDWGMQFLTTTSGGGGYTAQMTIQHDGNIGIGDTTPNALLDLDSTSTTGLNFLITNTGVGLSGSVATVTANSYTTGDILTLNGTALTTGQILEIVGPSSGATMTGNLTQITSNIGSAGSLMFLDPNFTGAAVTGTGLAIDADDSTNNANTNQALFIDIDHTGNAAKVGYGLYEDLSSTSTSLDTLIGIDQTISNTATSDGKVIRGLRGTYTGTGATSGTTTITPLRLSVAGTHADDVGTLNLFGSYVDVANNTTGNGNATLRAYYAEVLTGGDTLFGFEAVMDADTTNSTAYGLYSQMSASGTGSTVYGLYTDVGTGGGTEYAAAFLNGNVGIGISAPGARLALYADVASDYAVEIAHDGNDANRLGMLVQAGADSGGTGTLVQFFDGDGTDVGEITFSGTTTTYSTSSDQRIKDNIVDTHFGLNDLLSIKPRDYVFNTDNSGQVRTGFIAQELYQVYPEAVVVPDDPDKWWSVDYGRLTPLIVKGIQELNYKVDNALLTLGEGGLVSNQIQTDKITVSGDADIGGLVSASNFALDASLLNRTGTMASIPVSSEGKVTVADSLNALTTHISQLDSEQTSQSAQLAEVQQLSNQAIEQSSSLDQKVASTSANLASLSSQIQELLNDTSPDSPNPPSLPDLTPPSELTATGSATLANLNITDKISTLNLEALDATISGTLKSLGESFLGKTTIAGDVSIDGTFSITEGKSINAFPVLFLQNNPLAEAIDIFNGKVAITKEGVLYAKEVVADQIKVTKDKSSGTAILPAGQTQIQISSNLTESDSIIILTPETVISQPLSVTNKISGISFTIKTASPQLENIKINYLIIGQKEAGN